MSQELEWSNLPEALFQAGSVLYQLLIYLSLVVFIWPITFISMGLLLVKHEKKAEMVSLSELNSIESNAFCSELTVSSSIQAAQQFSTPECNFHSEEQCQACV